MKRKSEGGESSGGKGGDGWEGGEGWGGCKLSILCGCGLFPVKNIPTVKGGACLYWPCSECLV